MKILIKAFLTIALLLLVGLAIYGVIDKINRSEILYEAILGLEKYHNIEAIESNYKSIRINTLFIVGFVCYSIISFVGIFIIWRKKK